MYKILNSRKNFQDFLNNTNNYLNTLKSKKYKNPRIFEKYIKNVDIFISFRKEKIQKSKILENIEIYELMLKSKKETIFENCDHDKKFCKSFHLLSYFIYNIFLKIWKNKKVFEKDVENLPEKNRVFISKVIFQKFNKLLNLNNVLEFLKDLNNLANFKFFKRKEEVIKYISRNFLKYLNNLFDIEKLKKIFFENCGKKIFEFYFYLKNKKIYVKKFSPEIRVVFLKIQIFKEKFKEFKIWFVNKKKKFIDVFFFKLMKKKGCNFQKFKKFLQNCSQNDFSVYKTKDQNLIDIKYPWTIPQIFQSFNLFESKSKK